jgi:hypothetical protein
MAEVRVVDEIAVAAPARAVWTAIEDPAAHAVACLRDSDHR